MQIKHKNTGEVILNIENLHDADLSGADLSGAYLHGANLYGANLHGADLSGANLHGADLNGANLSGANLRDADLLGANLYGANLRDADLLGADLFGANLSGAKGILVITPIGSRGDCLIANVVKGEVRFKTGCFYGNEKSFITSLKRTHKGNQHYKVYLQAIRLAREFF